MSRSPRIRAWLPGAPPTTPRPGRVLALLAVLALACGEGDPFAPAGGLLRFEQVAAGHSSTCAVTTSDAVWCWGFEAMNRIGVQSDAPPCDGLGCTLPVPQAGSVSLRDLSLGEAHGCGLSGREAFCWGWGWHGQLGVGSDLYQRCRTPDGVNPLPCSLVPVNVALGFPVVRITAGANHTCAVTASADAYCWGLNQFGQRGDGTRDNASTPTLVAGGHAFVEIGAGMSHTCALAADGSAWCWGANADGRLGDGTTVDSPVPVPVAGGLRFRTIETGYEHACGVTTDELVYCWGLGLGGRLGNGADTSAAAPVAVLLPATPVHRISAGDGHTCAILGENADVYCWGFGFAGQLGNGIAWNRNVPTRISLDGPFTAVSAGKLHACAIDADAVLHCWGHNEFGQLGTGSTVDALEPQPVAAS